MLKSLQALRAIIFQGYNNRDRSVAKLIFFSTLSSEEKRWEVETSDLPKVIEPICEG